jgi:DNA gyrase subunit A
VSAVLSVRTFEENRYVMMATRKGVVKKTPLVAFSHPRQGGIIAITIDQGDELIGVKITDGAQDIFMGTMKGQAIRFRESDVRPMGRGARGVIGIRLRKGDCLVGMEIPRENSAILTVTELAIGKRTSISEYRVQGRGGQGIRNIMVTPKSGSVVGILQVVDESQFMMVTEAGKLIRIKVEENLRLIGRSTQGVSLQGLAAEDKVVAIAQFVEEGQ